MGRLGGRKMLLALLVLTSGVALHATVGLNEHITTLLLGVAGIFAVGNGLGHVGKGLAAKKEAKNIRVDPTAALDAVSKAVAGELSNVYDVVNEVKAMNIEVVKSVQNSQKISQAVLKMLGPIRK